MKNKEIQKQINEYIRACLKFVNYYGIIVT